MRLIIHDLSKEQAELFFGPDSSTKVIYPNGPIRPCQGCKACQASDRGMCVIKDGYHMASRYLQDCDELMVVSRLVYGGFSPFVKNVFDRSRGCFTPMLENRQKALLPGLKKPHQMQVRVLFYGQDLVDWEKETAQRMVEQLSHQLGGNKIEVEFEPQDLGGVLC